MNDKIKAIREALAAGLTVHITLALANEILTALDKPAWTDLGPALGCEAVFGANAGVWLSPLGDRADRADRTNDAAPWAGSWMPESREEMEAVTEGGAL